MATIVLDADGVLWAGIITYGDPVIPTPGIQAVLKELKKRGHAVVVCSRNEEERLLLALREHGLMPYVDQAWTTWGPKSAWFNEFHRIGEPTVFVDDNPINCAEISALYPDVEVLPAQASWDPFSLLEHPKFSRDATPEDRRRVQLLKDQQLRETAEMKYGGPYQQFLMDSRLVLTIYPDTKDLPDPPRALDLLNRTNELKTSANRYQALPADRRLMTASLIDQFGDYGLIAVAVVDMRAVVAGLDDLAVSCRTMGRGIGSAMVAFLCRDLVERTGYRGLVGIITPTDKNGPMRSLYEVLGFDQVAVGKNEKNERWIWRYQQGGLFPPVPPWITVRVGLSK